MWYSLPENKMKLEELKFPKQKKKEKKRNREMREWASSNGAVAQQRSGRQETTMVRSKTLSKKMHIIKNSNQSVMSTKNILTNMKVITEFGKNV